MGYTTGQTTSQMAAVLVTAGAKTDQALQALHTNGHKPGRPATLWGVLVQCTSGWNGSGDAVWEYDTTPAAGSAGQSLAQATATLVAAGATTDQAIQALHSLAWTPNQNQILWGCQVKCTTGWNAGTAVVYSVNNAPS